jgi:MFS family permease
MSTRGKYTPSAFPILERHRARRLGYWNGVLWAIGNGLASSTLVVYLALELDAPGLGVGISLILAAPRIAGLLRLLVPALITRLGDTKRFCLGMYLASALVLCGLPLAASPGWLPSSKASLAALVAFWCVYHLLEFFGLVAMLSWFADLVPLRIRGRFLGRRQRWMLVGQAMAMLAAGLAATLWSAAFPQSPRWLIYAILAALGAGVMLIALVPLCAMPSTERKAQVSRLRLRELLAPLADLRFLRFVCFGCWFSFFNGLTQTVQRTYPAKGLGLALSDMLTLETGMRLGQLAISPRLGRMADRWGNKPLMLACLPLVASGLLFYAAATPSQPWWIVGAWGLWIAYAGINVGLPNLMLKLAPQQTNPAYIATFQGLTDLCVAASTLLGGWLYDRYLRSTVHPTALGTFDFYQLAFLAGTLTRAIGVVVLLLVKEPAGRTRRA